jgi:hypothetical protein
MWLQVILMYPLLSILFGGRLIRKDLPPEWWRWIFYISPFYYGFAGLMNTEYKGLHIDCSYASLSGCPQGDQVLAQYSVMEVSLTESNITSPSLYVAYTITCFLIFRYFQGFLDLPWGRSTTDPARKVEQRPPLALTNHDGERRALTDGEEKGFGDKKGGYGSVDGEEKAPLMTRLRTGSPPLIQFRNLTYTVPRTAVNSHRTAVNARLEGIKKSGEENQEETKRLGLICKETTLTHLP